jgi:hypothetical protein
MNSKVFVTPKDLKALQLVCDQGAVTLDQLWSFVWKVDDSASKKYAYSRTQTLIDHGLLRVTYAPLTRYRFLLSTAKGRNTVASATHKPVPDHCPRPAELLHAERLTDIRLLLTRSRRLQDWQSDRVLVLNQVFPKDRFREYLPDAVWVNHKGARVFVEYERTQKSKTRVQQKVEAYTREIARADRFADHVLWICEPPSLPSITKAVNGNSKHTVRSYIDFKTELEQKI